MWFWHSRQVVWRCDSRVWLMGNPRSVSRVCGQRRFTAAASGAWSFARLFRVRSDDGGEYWLLSVVTSLRTTAAPVLFLNHSVAASVFACRRRWSGCLLAPPSASWRHLPIPARTLPNLSQNLSPYLVTLVTGLVAIFLIAWWLCFVGVYCNLIIIG